MEKQNRIEVHPYNPDWADQFTQEANQIKEVLGENCLAVHHVGSTAVPGLAAKPKIDIIAVVKTPEDAIEKLKIIGFDYRGEYNIPMHYGFSKRNNSKVNLHVYQEGNPEIELNLTFRDYLRSHPEVRDAYADLKFGLLENDASFEKNGMFSGYNLGKNSFIQRVLQLAKFNRLRFVKCTHYEEWNAAKKMRQKHFFDKVPISDPYQWTFNHPDHVHFLLYKGVKIIGYAHIQLWVESRAALRIIVVEEAERKQGCGQQFLEWIETWLKSQNFKSIHTESSPDALHFYKRLGYVDLPFNDPDGYIGDSRDIPLGKHL